MPEQRYTLQRMKVVGEYTEFVDLVPPPDCERPMTLHSVQYAGAKAKQTGSGERYREFTYIVVWEADTDSKRCDKCGRWDAMKSGPASYHCEDCYPI